MKIRVTSHQSILEATTAPQNIGSENATSFDVYRRLRSDIVSGNLTPNTPLRSEALCEIYEVGVGNLREALSHLVSDGLVRTESGKGFRVAPVSKTDLIDITEWRVEFEVRAVVESIRRGDDAWEAEIVTAYHLLSKSGLPNNDATPEAWMSYGEKHTRFHDALASGCGSPWLLYFRGVLSAQAKRYQALAVRRAPLVYRNDNEHRYIMEAALDRDEKKAAKLVESHIRKTAEVVIKDFQKGASN